MLFFSAAFARIKSYLRTPNCFCTLRGKAAFVRAVNLPLLKFRRGGDLDCSFCVLCAARRGNRAGACLRRFCAGRWRRARNSCELFAAGDCARLGDCERHMKCFARAIIALAYAPLRLNAPCGGIVFSLSQIPRFLFAFIPKKSHKKQTDEISGKCEKIA